MLGVGGSNRYMDKNSLKIERKLNPRTIEIEGIEGDGRSMMIEFEE